jgi:uncharacterized protein YbjT (DUF2867 family)
VSDNRIIAVVGATGSQGGGLVRAIQANPEAGFTARAITRNVNSDKAKALAELGAEVVAANVDEPESLKQAFEGAHGAFCVTFFFAHFSPDQEIAQAAGMAEAAKHAGVQHVIWSTLEDTRKWVPLDDDRMPTLMGNYKVPHLDSKGVSDAVFRNLNLPTTFLLTSFYWENFINSGMAPQKGPDGKYAIGFPMGDKKMPGIAAADIGKCCLGIFQRRDLIGQTVGIAGEHLTGNEIAATLGEALGFDVAYNDIPPDVYRGLDFPGADELGNMFQFKRDFDDVWRGARDPEFARQINPEIQTLKQWLAANKDRIPIQSDAASG